MKNWPQRRGGSERYGNEKTICRIRRTAYPRKRDHRGADAGRDYSADADRDRGRLALWLERRARDYHQRRILCWI